MSATDLTDQSATGGSIGRGWGLEPPTRTIDEAVKVVVEGVVENVGHLRNVVKLQAEELNELHRSADVVYSDALEIELQATTSQRAKEDLGGLLEELNGLGFSWRDVARIAHVSVPALRKWRMGASATGENRRRVAEVAAFCQMAREKYLIEDVAGWLETPLHSEAPVTGLDLLAGDRFDLVLRLASDYGENPEQVLDEFEPGWRDRYASTVQVFTAPDGLPGVRLVERES